MAHSIHRADGRLAVLLAIGVLLACQACSGQQPATPAVPAAAAIAVPAPLAAETLPPLPEDRPQPFDRVSSAAPASVFQSGDQFFLRSADTEVQGRSMELDGGAPGGSQLSWAVYRMPMDSSIPGSLSVDANILPAVLGTPRQFHIAVSDYAGKRWRWLAPVAGSHSIFSLRDIASDPAELLSPAGSLFVAIAVFGGTDCDVVGLGVEPLDAGDSVAPAAPAALDCIARPGALELSWPAVEEDDLAGYRVYWHEISFLDSKAHGVRVLPQLVSPARALIRLPDNWPAGKRVHARVFAVDHSGNESAPGPLAYAAPLPGSPPAFLLHTDLASVSESQPANFTCSGAELYDLDSDADGQFEQHDLSSGSHQLITSAAGISRMLLRGRVGDDACNLSDLSVLVSANTAPQATADASTLSGKQPLKVFFAGTAEDAEDSESQLSFAWDFDGDGLYEENTDTLDPAPYTYQQAGDFTARLRVQDSAGATATAEVQISVKANAQPVAQLSADPLQGAAPLTVNFDASASTDEDGYVANYEWDWNGDGEIDFDSEEDPTVSHEYTAAGLYDPVLTITDNNGAIATATLQVGAKGWALLTLESDGTVGKLSTLQEIDGNPAVLCDYLFIDGSFNFNRRLVYMRSSTQLGLRRSDWGTSVMIPLSPHEHPLALLEVADKPALFAAGGTGIAGEGMLVGHSSTAHGTLLEDWDWENFFTVGSGDRFSRSLSAALITGNPAASFVGASSALYYLRSSSAGGAEPADWAEPVQVAETHASYVSTSLCLVDGAPAIAYANLESGDLIYVRSSSPDGMDAGDWESPLAIFDGPDETGAAMWPSLALVGGKPAISFQDAQAGVLRYASSSTADGAASEDWSVSLADNTAPTGQYSSLVEYEGLPAISYYHVASQDLRLAQSSSLDGALPEDWTVQTIDSKDLVGQYTSLKVIGGVPRIAYYHVSSLDLRYAVLYE